MKTFKIHLSIKVRHLTFFSGTIQSDFAPQLNSMDRTKYTLLSWDPIGYGKSRPPERRYVDDFYVNDARVVGKLMEVKG